MDYDQKFRIVLIAGALIVFPIMAHHRRRLQATGERLDRSQEGLFILFTLRPVGLVAMVGLAAFMINPSLVAWSSVALPQWLRWTGVALGVLAGGLLIWTLRSLGTNLTPRSRPTNQKLAQSKKKAPGSAWPSREPVGSPPLISICIWPKDVSPDAKERKLHHRLEPERRVESRCLGDNEAE